MTPRDVAIIRLFQTHRYLSTPQILAVIPGSAQRLRRRLRLLYDARFLDKPEAQRAFPETEDKHHVYALGDRGAALLREEQAGSRLTHSSWRTKNREVTRDPIRHELLLADFLIGVRRACESRADVDFIPLEEILTRGPKETRRSAKPLHWQVPVSYGGRREPAPCVPDGCFGLRIRPKDAVEFRTFFFVEIDNGTMPAQRKAALSFWRQSSFLKKGLAYTATKAEDIQRARFGIKSFRVLTVAKTPARTTSLSVAVMEAMQGKLPNLFLFTDRETLGDRSPLEIEWANAKGEPIRLAD